MYPSELKLDSDALPEIGTGINTTYRTATTTRPAPLYCDPLAVDLDGDGTETVGINANGQVVTFDHNADGVRTGSGWVSGDDAWLVLDRNGNGSIDSGRELFGVDTFKADGQLATNALNNTMVGNAGGSERLYGRAGNDTLTAVGNNDTLEGGEGDDVLVVGSAYVSGTTFMGGAGNDTLSGSCYSDTYRFNRGDGADTLDAELASVSHDAISDEQRGLIYASRVRMARTSLTVDGAEVRLSPGMAVTVEVKTGNRRVIEYFLAPLLRHTSESLRER